MKPKLKGKSKRGKQNSKGNKKPTPTTKDFFNKHSKKKVINRWTEGEYLKLVELVREHGENWEKISEHFGNKSGKQCMQKFKNSARSARKGNWTKEEDRILLDWVSLKGPNKWTECSKKIRGRCGKQCRERWVNILNPKVKKGNWSPEEQRLIFLNLKRFYTSWSLMANELEGRTENSIKNYFYSSIRRLKSNDVIIYLREVYGREEGESSFQGQSPISSIPDYPRQIYLHLGYLVQNKLKIQRELEKLNCLSRLICEFMLDFGQVRSLNVLGKEICQWNNNFQDPLNGNFLKFLVEIILELNKKKKRKKTGMRRPRYVQMSKGRLLFFSSNKRK
jgi:hypothetical protein